ncbi:MAG: hypothetical protein R3C39_04835 [Dehalococcoidia bacterium]
MLGEQIGELTGKTTGNRVLPGEDGRHVKIETSWELSGTVLGTAASDIGTIVSFERVPGQLFSEGQGVLMTEAGGAIYSGSGVGSVGEGMSIQLRFAVTFQAGGDGPLARLNSVVGVGEFETDAEGNVTARIWEWK